MRPVSVRIMHPGPDAAAGPIERWVASVRAGLAEQHVAAFRAAGATDVEVVTGRPDGTPFGARLRGLLQKRAGGGLVVLGSGAIPLATAADRRAFVEAAGADTCRALANNRYSADAVAIARVDQLAPIPDLPGDNALPRWLEEVAGYSVDDLRRRWRLAVDIDGPLDLVLLGWLSDAPVDLEPVRARLAAIRTVAADRRAELVVAGRTSAATLAWLEGHASARGRAWVEERGLRAAAAIAQAGPRTGRPAASLLGSLLDRDGPGALGGLLARFGDGAIVDSRVLLAHRVGGDETAWPCAGDRFASDLLLPERIGDPWLHELTASAAAAPIPVVLGGHSLVGPGVRLIIGGRGVAAQSPRWT